MLRRSEFLRAFPGPLLFVLLACAATLAHAQDLVIEYDAVSGGTSFYEREYGAERPTSTVAVRLGGNVILRVKNLNGTLSYLTKDSRTLAVMTTGYAAGDSRATLMGSTTAPPAASTVTGIGRDDRASGVSVSMRLQELKDLVNNVEIRDRRNNIWSNKRIERRRDKRGRVYTVVVEDPDAGRIADNAIELLRIINDNYACYASKSSDFLREQQLAIQNVESAQFQLRTILHDDARPESEVKGMSNQVAAALIGGTPPSSGAVSREAVLSKRSQRLNELIGMYRDAEACFRRFVGAKSALDTIVRANPQIISRIAQTAAGKVHDFPWLLDNAVLNSDIDACRGAYAVLENHLIARYDTVCWLYEKIWAGTYTQEITIPARENRVDVDLKIRDRNSVAGANPLADPGESARTVSYSIPVTGGLQLSASAGLGFSYFFNRQFGYANRDSVIMRDSSNLVSPGIAAFVHMRARTAGSFTLGLSIGLSWAVLTDRRLSFLFGPSAFFGESERLVLTAGAALGEVDRLDNGRQLGDKLESATAAVPTQKGYAPGAFVALTYNF